jgi:hypothetical protein
MSTFVRDSWGLLLPQVAAGLARGGLQKFGENVNICYPFMGFAFLRFGWCPFSAARALPSAVFGPLESPPWNLQRPFS